jgi:phosphatidylserine/phosphatidylglycerophosphate/cardiolipin synthase-like enzyme
MKFLSFVLISFLSFGVQAQESLDTSWLAHLDLQGQVVLFTGPSLTAHQPFSAMIAQAHHSVLMEMYHMIDQDVTNALLAARGRGADVNVILDGSSLRNSPYIDFGNSLAAGGVAVFASSPAFTITHSKSMVVDGVEGIVSSMNLTLHPETRRDYGVMLQDPGVLAEMTKVFEADIQNSKNRTGFTPPLSDPHLLWSPVNSVAKLHVLIATAQRSIVAVAENILDDGVINDLIAAAQRGVVVRVMSPACPMGQRPDGNYNTAIKLANGGVNIRQMPDPSTPTTPYLHGKMMVVDDARAYIGSINYSFNSLNKARELGIVLNNPQVIAGLDQTFEQDFANAIPLTPNLPSCPPVNGF